MNKELKSIFEQGVEKYRSGSLLEAESLFKKALEMDPTEWEIRFYLGMALERQQKHREAKNEFMSIRDWCPAPDLRQRAATAFSAII